MSGISTLSGSFSTDTSVNSPIWITADSGQNARARSLRALQTRCKVCIARGTHVHVRS